MINIPVLIIGFKRKNTLIKIIDTMREAKISKVYFSFDSGRTEKENEICKDVQKVIDLIDWDCEIKCFIEEKNSGCPDHLINSLNWFFKNEEMGIILEDDIIPINTEFYSFCQDMLNLYKNQKIVKTISCFSYVDTNDKNSYYYSILQSTWGWATWRDRFFEADLTLKTVSEEDFIDSLKFYNLPINVFSYYLYLFRRTKEDWKSLNTWDYNFLFNIMKNKGVCIQANTSLVKNEGNDEYSIHFDENSKTIKENIKGSIYPIIHPDKPIYHIDYDLKRIYKEYIFLK